MRRSARAIATALAVSLPVAACGPTLMDVPYRMAGMPAPVADAAAQRVSVVGTDGRLHPGDVVGLQGAGPLLVRNAIAATLAAGMQQEQAARGYATGAGHALVDVDVVTFRVDFAPDDQPTQAPPGAPAGTVVATVGIVVIVRNPAGAPVFARYGAAHAAQPYYFNTSNAPEAKTELTEAMRRVVTTMIDDPAFRQGVRGAQ